MKQILYRNLVLIILIVKVVGNNYAQTIPTPINNTPTVLNNLDGKAVFSQSFLTLPIDPRSMSMGLTKIATEPSVYNAYYNPSIIPFTYNSLTSFNLNYLPWTSSNNINDIYYLSAAAFYKINARNTLSSTVRFSNFGKINLLTENLTEIGAANPYNLAVDLSYAKKITNTLSLALTGRYILNDIGANAYNNNIDIILSHSFAADLSLSYLKVLYNNDAIYWGMCISNLGATLGSRYTYDFKNYLPTNFGTGISYNKFVNKYNLVSLSFELNRLMIPLLYIDKKTGKALNKYESMNIFNSYAYSFYDNKDGFLGELGEFSVGLGLEWIHKDRFAFRTGLYKDAAVVSNNKLFAVGLGLQISENLRLDMSYNTNLLSDYTLSGTPFNNALRFGIIFNKIGSHFDHESSSVKCVSPN